MPDTGPAGNRASARWRNAALVVLGLALLAALLWATDTSRLLDHLRTLGWRAPLVLVPYCLIALADAFGWRFTLPRDDRTRVPMRTFYLARLSGEAINSVTPTATVGGEPVKAHLLRPWGVSGGDAMASVVLSRTALVASQSLFVAMGVAALSYHFGYRAVAVAWLAGLALATGGFVFLLVRLQQRAPASALTRLVRRAFPRWHLLDRIERGATSVDERLGDFYRFEQGAFLQSMAAHLGGWLLGVGEVLVMMALIGRPVGMLDAFIIESLSQVVRALAIVIPGGLGTQEWGGTAVCELLGIPRAEGVTLWLLKRARETLFDVIGLVYLTQRVGRSPQ